MLEIRLLTELPCKGKVGLPATYAPHVYSTHVWQKVYVDHDCVALLWIPFMAALPSSFTCYAYKS